MTIEQAIVEAYRRGKKSATREWAIWKDGKQFIGILARPLEHELDEIQEMEISPECIALKDLVDKAKAFNESHCTRCQQNMDKTV